MNDPQSSSSSFGTTLRRIGELSQSSEIKRLIVLLASQLELAFNQQGNTMYAALSGAEFGWWGQLDIFRKHIDAEFQHVNARQTQMLKMLEELQDGIRDLQRRPPCMYPDAAGEQLEVGGDG